MQSKRGQQKTRTPEQKQRHSEAELKKAKVGSDKIQQGAISFIIILAACQVFFFVHAIIMK